MAVLYPSGYAGAWRTLEQFQALTTVQRLHPEVWRRMSALMVEAAEHGARLGVGTGWRRQPSDGRPGFAAPGNSYHEGFMPGGTTRPDGVNDRNAMAIDTVLTEAWPWMNANCGRFGFVHFAHVNNEPWHIQPVEIPRSRNFATAQPALQTWPLPTEGLIVTADDVTQMKAMLEAQTKAIITGWGVFDYSHLSSATGSGADLIRQASRADDVLARLVALDPAAITKTITDAVMAALEDVEVNANLSPADIAAIAAASAQAVIAEIAS